MRGKGDGKNQGSILTIEKLVFSGNSHNPFQLDLLQVDLSLGLLESLLSSLRLLLPAWDRVFVLWGSLNLILR